MSQAEKEATARWNFTTFTLIRWQSIRTISMREHFIISTKKISNFFHLPYFQRLSATFQFFSLQRLSVTFLLQLGGYVLPQAIDRHPLIKRRIVQSSHSKKKIKKKNSKSKCHFLNFLSHWGGCVRLLDHKWTTLSTYI